MKKIPFIVNFFKKGPSQNERGDKMSDKIVIQGAKVHNLKNISLKIPRNKLVVITGLSGSRKVFFGV